MTRTRTFSTTLKLGGALIAFAAAATPLHAQEGLATSANASDDDGEILVTARRRTENLLNVPIAISAYSGEQLEMEGALDITMPATGQGHGAPIYLGRLMPGALVGEMALISGAQRSADVVAHGGARCLCIGADALGRLRAEDPPAAYALLAAMARQLERNLRYANAATQALEE